MQTAEMGHVTFEEIISASEWQPLVIEAHETVYEQTQRIKAAQFIGSVAVDERVALDKPRPLHTYTLKEAIHEAANGDEDARGMVRTNVATDVIERTIKSGHIMSVELDVDNKGTIFQYGQSTADIHANSLIYGSSHPWMRERTSAEVRNKFRTEEALSRGLLEDYALLVISRVPVNMTDTELAQAGFFTDTMSMAIQATSFDGGKLQLESAFVAGRPDSSSPRQDKEMVEGLGDALGVNLKDRDDVELIDSPLLVHKTLMPNGVVDIVKILDEVKGTFFGEDKPMQDYLAYKEKCKQREEELGPRIETITNRLISEAKNIFTPQEASQRLGKLSGEEMIKQSITDHSINPSVFGSDAAYRIEHARFLTSQGEFEHAIEMTYQAVSYDNSSSCQGGVSITRGGMDSQNQEEPSATERPKDCDFVSKECPKCHKKNVHTVVKNGKYYGACGCHS